MEQNVNARKVSIDIVKANVFSVAILVVTAIVSVLLFVLIWRGRRPVAELTGGALEWVAAMVLMVVGIAVHELIHGITWACFAPSGWRSIKFGVMWKLLTPYCHCSEPMNKRQYITGAMMPCLVLGLVPIVVALCIGNLPMLVWGIFFTAAAAGDIWMSWLLMKEPPRCKVLDHPSEAGFYVIEEGAD